MKQKRNDDGTIKYRVRGTAGGNLLDVPYDVLARTASLDVVKLHSTVSDQKHSLVPLSFFSNPLCKVVRHGEE